MSISPVTALAEITDAVAQLVGAVREEQWSAPTPCAEWNVGQLVDHVVAGQRTFTEVMGSQPLPARDAYPGPDAVEKAFRDSAATLVAAFAGPDALERIVTAPVGAVPGAVALHLVTIDHLAHGWDLARATGQQPAFDDVVVEREIDFAQGLVGQLPDGPNAPFAPSLTVPDDAPALDRLAALLGRRFTG